eukprot:Hpha_TRINITY_DN14836_c1_g3::TRINITY_DN14836_c1_g3_i1::g.169981::m.169981
MQGLSPRSRGAAEPLPVDLVGLRIPQRLKQERSRQVAPATRQPVQNRLQLRPRVETRVRTKARPMRGRPHKRTSEASPPHLDPGMSSSPGAVLQTGPVPKIKTAPTPRRAR